MKSFRTYVNRLDRNWTVFAADEDFAAEMVRAIGCNGYGHWKKSKKGLPMIQNRNAADVIADLRKEGWTVA